MERKKLVSLAIITVLGLLTGCSSKTPEVDKSNLTAYNILGIEGGSGTHAQAINDLPLAQTYPIEESYRTPVDNRRMVLAYAPPPPQNYYYENRPYVRPQSHIRPQPIAYQQPNVNRNSYRNNRASNRNNVISSVESGAKRLLGIKYVWGATGPHTYDCSGFTQKVYRDAGIPIPRVSRDQAKVGQYVTYNNLTRGDMVFFDTHKKRTGKVTHVGIYLGNGNFIHASSGAKKVVIFNFNEKEFYKKRFLWGRRVIQDNVHFASL